MSQTNLIPRILHPVIIQESQSSATLFPSTINDFPTSRCTGAQGPENMDQISQAAQAQYPSLSSIGTEAALHASSMRPEGIGTAKPQKKKQKRNKPTLSCIDCVERKTKVSAFF